MRRINWDNVFGLLFILVMILAFCTIAFKSFTLNDYEIEYQEYIMQENDSLFNVVQDQNEFFPFGWDAHDMVGLAIKKNDIQDVSKIRVGQRVLIPITKEKGVDNSETKTACD